MITSLCLAGLIPLMMYAAVATKKHQADELLALVESLIDERVATIPPLLALAEEGLAEDEGLLVELAKLREQSIKPQMGVEEKMAVYRGLTGIVERIASPVNKTAPAYAEIMAARTQTPAAAGRLAAAQRAYDQCAADFNRTIEMFPFTAFAARMGWTSKPLLSSFGEDPHHSGPRQDGVCEKAK